LPSSLLHCKADRFAPRDDRKEVVILSEAVVCLTVAVVILSEAKDLLRLDGEGRSFVALLLRMTERKLSS
jgi:hypothetical protein